MRSIEERSATGCIPLARGAEMETADAISRILQSERGHGVCDACLAFAADMSLAAVQGINSALTMRQAEYVRMSAACHNCGRLALTTAFVGVATAGDDRIDTDRRRKCVRCSRRVTKDEEHIHNGDLFHRQCWAVLRSQAEIANSRQTLALTRALIRQSRERLHRADIGDSDVSDA